jgi:hypothetical protein
MRDALVSTRPPTAAGMLEGLLGMLEGLLGFPIPHPRDRRSLAKKATLDKSLIIEASAFVRQLAQKGER